MKSTSDPTLSPLDYVIVGAGSAGCVLANRRSADPPTNVLPLEARIGSLDDADMVRLNQSILIFLGLA